MQQFSVQVHWYGNMIRKIFNIQKNIFWAGLLLAQFVLFRIFATHSFFINIADHFFEWRKNLQPKLFAWLPFSAGDILYLLFGIYILYALLLFLLQRKKRYLRKILIALNIFYFTYQTFWGLLYFQKPISENLPETEITNAQIEFLTEKYLQRCIEDRRHVKENSLGIFEISDKAALTADILQNQKNIPHFITGKSKIKTINIKPSLYSRIMSDTGILGYYNPFTSEVQFNPHLPDTYIPFTLAHESAHQIGFAREQEANFIGFLIGKNAENPDLKYSTDYFVLKNLLNYYADKNPDYVRRILQKYPTGMKRDRLNEKAFAKRHEGWLDRFFGISNDLFLKSNKQEGSVTYSYFINLLIQYEQDVYIKK